MRDLRLIVRDVKRHLLRVRIGHVSQLQRYGVSDIRRPALRQEQNSPMESPGRVYSADGAGSYNGHSAIRVASQL